VALLWFHPLFQTLLVVGDPTQQAKYLQHAGFLVRAAAKVRINRFGNCILVFSKNRLQLDQVLQPGFQAGVGILAGRFALLGKYLVYTARVLVT
jgi:hypothetical protein